MGSLSNDDDDDGGSENVAKKVICVLSNFIASFGPAQFVKCTQFFLELHSQGLYPGSKRETYIHVLYKTSHQEVSRRSRAVDVKDMYQ